MVTARARSHDRSLQFGIFSYSNTQLTLKVKLINHRYLNELVNYLFQFNKKVLM